MNLSQAIHYGPYPGAVCFVLQPVPLIAHVCRQGGYGVHEWWTASTSPIVYDEEHQPLGYTLYSPYWDTMSFGTIDGCYTWLKERHIPVNVGWYATRGHERFWELGVSQLGQALREAGK